MDALPSVARFACLILGTQLVFLVHGVELLHGASGIAWKTSGPRKIVISVPPQATLPKLLSSVLRSFARHPDRITLHPKISGLPRISSIQGRTPEGVFSLLLSRHGLLLVSTNDKHLIVPQEEYWRHQPFNKIFLQPVSLEQVLKELSQAGRIPIRFDANAVKGRMVNQNLSGKTVEQALSALATRQNAMLVRHPLVHRLEWVQDPRWEFRYVPLENTMQSAMREFLESIKSNSALQLVKISYPDEDSVLLYGRETELELIEKLIRNFDRNRGEDGGSPANREFRRTVILDSITVSELTGHLQPMLAGVNQGRKRVTAFWQSPGDHSGNFTAQTEPLTVSFSGMENPVNEIAENLLALDRIYREQRDDASLLVQRVRLRYLHVGDRKVRSNGRDITLPGVEARLRELLDHLLDDDPLVPQNFVRIIPDFLRNAVVLQGKSKHLEWLRKVLETWDQPTPQIRIEAHIFETNESDSLRLGMEFSGRGIAQDGSVNAEVEGPFSAGLIFGPVGTTEALRIDAILRFLQSQGRGRVLSRPLVVSANNIEAEMNSGSVIHVRLVGEKTTSLQELKTGVTLRVTPRLIEHPSDNRSRDRVLLNVYAETSIPLSDSVIDGIPPINSQSARSEVIVRNGQPFLVGGLIKDQAAESESGVPYLRDLPLLGPLFQSTGATGNFNHILVFVTPTRVMPEELQMLPEPEKLGKSSTSGRLIQ